MGVISFNIDYFRQRFPEFSDDRIFEDATLTVSWDIATCYLTPEEFCFGNCRELALQLMTAHLQKLSLLTAAGQSTALIISATVDKVSVSATPPPVKSQLEWWLNTTPYGAQLWALLQVNSVGGFYIGGSPVLSAFRKFDGSF